MLDQYTVHHKVSHHRLVVLDHVHVLVIIWIQLIYIQTVQAAGELTLWIFIFERTMNFNFWDIRLILPSIPYRFSTSGSTHNLSNCYDTSDNWTDNDMEIYMTRNATARTGLVPLWGRLFISWYIDVLLDLDKVFWHLDSYDREHQNTPIVANDNLLFFVSLSDTSSSMPLNSFNESSNQHNRCYQY